MIYTHIHFLGFYTPFSPQLDIISSLIIPANVCTTHENNECEECDHAGLTLNERTKECNTNYCTCNNGVAQTGQNCEDQNSVDCSSCHGNFHLESRIDTNSRFIETQSFLANKNICVANRCNCQNGIPVDDDKCILHQADQCKECNYLGTDNAYHFNPQTQLCENVCSCNNGYGQVGSQCEVHRSENCLACDPNYHLEEDIRFTSVSKMKCEPNRCYCENGVKVDEGDCTSNDGHECKTCSTGYRLNDDKKCVAKICICENGTPVHSLRIVFKIQKRHHKIEKCRLSADYSRSTRSTTSKVVPALGVVQ